MDKFFKKTTVRKGFLSLLAFSLGLPLYSFAAVQTHSHVGSQITYTLSGQESGTVYVKIIHKGKQYILSQFIKYAGTLGNNSLTESSKGFMERDQLYPLHYQSGSGLHKLLTKVDFDYDHKRVLIQNGKRHYSMPMTVPALDHLSYPYQLQADIAKSPSQKRYVLDIVMVPSKERPVISRAKFENEGEKTLKVAGDTYKTIMLGSTMKINGKILKEDYWFSTDEDHLLLQKEIVLNKKVLFKMTAEEIHQSDS